MRLSSATEHMPVTFNGQISLLRKLPTPACTLTAASEMADAGLLSVGGNTNGRVGYQRASFKHLDIPPDPHQKMSMSMPNGVRTRKAGSLARAQSGMYLKVLQELTTIRKSLETSRGKAGTCRMRRLWPTSFKRSSALIPSE